MMLTLWCLVALVLSYVLFVTWAMRQPIEIFYHTFWSRVLRAVLADGMVAISLWRWVILLYPPNDRRGHLSVQGRVHELAGHIQNGEQWAGRPFSFPFRYLWELWRVGYDRNKYEEQARSIAGEPRRTP